MKKLFQQALLAGFFMICGQAFAAQDTSVQPTTLKTGTYRICSGSIDECKQGKGILGGDYLDFEKNSTGRYSFKYEETPFLWQQEGSSLLISMDDGGKHKIEVLNDSRMLLDYQDKNSTPYILIEDEDTVFKPGGYIQCDKAAVEKCDDLAKDYLESIENDDEGDVDAVLKNPQTVLILYFSAVENGQSELCLKGSSGCAPLTWEKEDTQIKASMSGTGANKKIFAIDRNKLIDAATGDVYLRFRNERVMTSAN